MKHFIWVASLLILITNSQAKVLDKILAVVDDNVITLSMVKRIKTNLVARKNISPLIYSKTKMTNKEIVSLLIQRSLVRSKLSDMRYVISDDQVESQIKSTEKKLGLNRDALLSFLRNNNITFDEYFELTRESIEFNIFNGRVIRPLISITDQEIKNSYYKSNIKNKTLAFRYTLVDFSLPKSSFKKNMLKNYRSMLTKFQINGVLPQEYSNLSTNVLGDITEDGLTVKLKSILKRTDEGTFSSPILLGSDQHIFYVKKKNLVESEQFLKSKEKIRNKLFFSQAKKVSDLWYKREENKHYIKYFF